MASMLDWNATRFDPGSPHGHVESHFLKLNDASGERALWLKATILRRLGETAVAEAWAVAFDRTRGHAAAKRVVPWATAAFSRDALAIRVGGVEIGPMRTRGALFTGDTRIEWDLAFAGGAAPFAPLPARLYGDDAGNSKIVSPHPDLHFDGHYCFGERYVDVVGWRGMQGHNWGRRHTHLYAWMHCNVWEDTDDLVVEGITARVKLGPVLAPPITLVIAEHAGARHFFTLPGSLWRARGRISPRAWEFRAANANARIRGSFAADTADFVGLHYENPDRAMTYCLNSKIARGSLQLEVGDHTLAAHTRAAALEIGTRDPNHGIEMLA